MQVWDCLVQKIFKKMNENCPSQNLNQMEKREKERMRLAGAGCCRMESSVHFQGSSETNPSLGSSAGVMPKKGEVTATSGSMH